MSVGQIAQLIEPADGFSFTRNMVADVARGRLFGFGSSGMRAWILQLVTQNPFVSADTTAWGTTAGNAVPADVDPVSGNIIAVWATGNGSAIRKVDPVSLTLIASYGASTSFPSYPTSIWYPQQVICVACGTLANPDALVGYALLKESEFSGFVAALRVSDQFTQAGFYTQVVSGSTDNRGQFCRGASGPAGASIFGSWSFTSPTPTIPLYKVAIAPGAELYNPASWPTTNPAITSATIGTIAATAVDATWTHLACSRIGYDQSDGNVLMIVTTNDSVATQNYLLKLNSSSAAILWKIALTSTVGEGTGLADGQYSGNIAPFMFSFAEAWTIDTTDGSHTSLAIGGLTPSVGEFSQFALTTTGLYVWNGTYNQGASANSPAPVDGTPTWFTGLALISEFFTPPAVVSATEIGDLWFAPTEGFVDFRVTSNRRLFVGDDGSTTFPGDNGEVPLGARPPLFLHLQPADGTAADFADNAGSGGAFTIAGGSLALVGSWPPCGVYTIPSPNDLPQGADPQVMLSVSDDGGRTFSALQKWRSLGEQGEYLKRLRWLKMGMFRQRQIRLEITDPVRRNIVGIYQDVSEGLDM